MSNHGTQKSERPRILVVDDVQANLKLVADILTGHGYQVRPASSGRLALSSVAAEVPDLIVLDVVMPDMDGYEVCRCLKSDEKSRMIPVIFISAPDETVDKVKGFEAGGVDCITKPFQPVEVLAKVEAHLSLHRLQKQLEGQNIQLQQEIAKRERIEEELRRHKAHLEELVAERTEDIKKINRELQQEMAERKLAEEKLFDSRQMLQMVLDNIPQRIFWKDRSSIFLGCNKPLALDTGYANPSELIGKTDYETASTVTADIYRADDRMVMETGLSKLNYEEPQIKPDGSPAWLRTSKVPLRDKDGRVIGVLGMYEDITERKLMEEALRQSQEKYRLIVDTANEGIWVLDEDGKTSFVNAQMADMLEYEAEEMISQEMESFIFEEDLPDHLQRMDKQRRGVAEDYERRWRRKDKQTVWTIVSATPIIDAEHHFHGSFAMILDITERKKLEEQLRQSQKMEAIGTLTGGIAHDFNNILTAIIGYGNLLRMRIGEEGTLKSYIDYILTASEKAAYLIQSLLAFSRKQVMSAKPVDLNEIVKKVDKLLLMVIGEDIEFKTMLADEELTVMADSNQVEQSLMNLVTNARDAMHDGGILAVQTERVEIFEEHNYMKSGSYAVISVSDTGKGMDEATKQRIFEPFFTTKEIGRGTGLGLSIVYGIIKQHNGEINVFSDPGKGTTFKIYLKLIKAKAGGMGASQLAPLVGGSETILIAEDDAAVRRLVKSYLEEFGYSVIEAGNGEDAVARFAENKDRIQLLILDVVMPKKNGREAYEEIRKMRGDVRVIFSSGYTEDIIQKQVILEERFPFITKPVTPQLLLSKVREVLDTYI